LSSAAVVGAIVLFDECAQMFIATRVPDTSDLVLAACGAALAWITLRTGQRVDARRRPG
jgi:glycopeptide antibiotics resistance protein